MKRDFTLLWGVLLVLAGLLFLVQTWILGGVWQAEGAWAAVWAVVFGGVGLTFGWVFATDPHRSWWAAIPGLTLLALSVLVGAHGLGWDSEGTWLGAFFLGMIGLSFWLIYAVRRDYWWALIPGGVLLTLAVVALTSTWSEGLVPGAIFFFGLALTFCLVAFLPSEHGNFGWALYPAIVLAVFGVIVLASRTAVVGFVWPLVLIVAGLFLLYRQYRSSHLHG
jgi:hypothetical protein